MPANDGPTLVIDDGGLPALVSVLLEQAPDEVFVWPIAATERGRIVSVSRARRLALGGVVGTATPAPEDASSQLIAAGHLARENGFRRVVWPVFCALDVDLMSATSARIRLVEELLTLESGPGESDLTINAPLFDLSESEICDLAVDLDASLDQDSVWWCLGETEERCGACEGCRTWAKALQGPRVWEAALAT